MHLIALIVHFLWEIASSYGKVVFGFTNELIVLIVWQEEVPNLLYVLLFSKSSTTFWKLGKWVEILHFCWYPHKRTFSSQSQVGLNAYSKDTTENPVKSAIFRSLKIIKPPPSPSIFSANFPTYRCWRVTDYIVSPKGKYTLLSSRVLRTEGARRKVGGAPNPPLSWSKI